MRIIHKGRLSGGMIKSMGRHIGVSFFFLLDPDKRDDVIVDSLIEERKREGHCTIMATRGRDSLEEDHLYQGLMAWKDNTSEILKAQSPWLFSFLGEERAAEVWWSSKSHSTDAFKIKKEREEKKEVLSSQSSKRCIDQQYILWMTTQKGNGQGTERHVKGWG